MPRPHRAALAPGEKRLVLTLTTGRSGTAWLARALGAFAGVKSLHEPKPTFSSAYRAVLAQPSVAREFWLEHKLPRIARHAQPVYAETSHLACKGFLEALFELGFRPDLIELRREPRAVASSLLALDTIPGRTLAGVKYYLSPWDGPGLLLPLEERAARELSDYQLCYWYCLEMEARSRSARERFEPLGARIVEARLERLAASAEAVLALGRELGLGAPTALGRLELRTLVGRRVNEKPEKKLRPVPPSDELERMEAELRRRLGLEA